MLTRFTIQNFKGLPIAEIDLGHAAVFVGPNNSGKTTALQALALWDIGWRRWVEKRDVSKASERSGVTINRKDLFAIPVPRAKLLWSGLHTQDSGRENGKSKTEKVFITLTAEGLHAGKPWVCALEYYYANEESFYCRFKPTDNNDGKVPEGARQHAVVFLPPMSGLAEREYRKEQGEINVLIGEGQTAQVLRNLCWQLFIKEDQSAWTAMREHIQRLFLISLNEPQYVQERSELSLTYQDSHGVELDLSSAGRGCQQVILLLSFMLANPGAVLLLDEPDAHLEVLRQRDVYNLITQVAQSNGAQIIAASHSEVVMQEAAERDVVVAFVGLPHRIDTRSRFNQVKKALRDIRAADYYIAEQKGWMLYLEGSTDLEILRALAKRLGHPAHRALEGLVPVVYLGSNQPQEARDHFYGLREAKADLEGYALFDRLDRELHSDAQLTEKSWRRREIENYIVSPESLRQYVQGDALYDDLFGRAEGQRRLDVLNGCINDITSALRLTNKADPWGADIKVTDEFLDPLFKLYFERMGTPQQIYKRDYHHLALSIPVTQIDQEVVEALDAILACANRAKPARS